MKKVTLKAGNEQDFFRSVKGEPGSMSVLLSVQVEVSPASLGIRQTTSLGQQVEHLLAQCVVFCLQDSHPLLSASAGELVSGAAASWLGDACVRAWRSVMSPDLVVRFGRGPTLPRSLRRPVAAVLV